MKFGKGSRPCGKSSRRCSNSSRRCGKSSGRCAPRCGEPIELAAQLRTEMGKLGGELHAEIHRAVSGSTRQMYLALLGQMAVMLGFFYFFLIPLR